MIATKHILRRILFYELSKIVDARYRRVTIPLLIYVTRVGFSYVKCNKDVKLGYFRGPLVLLCVNFYVIVVHKHLLKVRFNIKSNVYILLFYYDECKFSLDL